MMDTQAFRLFIEQRLDPSPDNYEVIYFDQMIVAKNNRFAKLCLNTKWIVT